MPHADGSPRWRVIVPLKDLTFAKSRLQRAPDDRARLMTAFASDVIGACRASPLVDHVTVVGSEEWRSVPLGDVTFVADPGGGLNAAVRAGLGACPDGLYVAVMVADLPCADSTAVTALLTAAQDAVAAGGLAVVPDLSGRGTTVLLGSSDLEPRFGPDSFARHRQAGAIPLVSHVWRSVRMDVDDAQDLDRAARETVGPATRDALTETGLTQ